MTHLLESLELYLWPLLAALTCGSLLAVMGTQVKARHEHMSILVANQATICTHLFALFLTSWLPLSLQGAFPKIAAVVAGVAALQTLQSFGRGNQPLQLCLFVALLCLSHIFAASNPSFEGQILRSLMGDVVLVSDRTAQLLTFLCLPAGILAWRHRKEALKKSFAQAVLGISVRSLGQPMPQTHRWMEFLLLCFFCFCTVELGFLFTMVVVLFPTQILSMFATRVHVQIGGVLLLSLFGVACGFLLSLSLHRVPTVPAIGLFILTLGGLAALVGKRQAVR